MSKPILTRQKVAAVLKKAGVPKSKTHRHAGYRVSGDALLHRDPYAAKFTPIRVTFWASPGKDPAAVGALIEQALEVAGIAWKKVVGFDVVYEATGWIEKEATV